jgi:nucleoid-associated protein EbfC
MGKNKAIRPGMRTPQMNPASAQNALQQLQQKMAATQEQLANETVEISVGGGAVTVIVSGQQKIQKIEISPEAISSNDKEMLQDLLVAAINQAIEKSQQLATARLNSITSGLNLPGLM